MGIRSWSLVLTPWLFGFARVAGAQPACGPISVTQSGSNAITPGNSFSCTNGTGHAFSAYYRAFALSDYGITNDFAVCSVQVGVETAVSSSGNGQPVTIVLFTSSMPFPTGYPDSLTHIGGASNVNVLDQSLALLDIPVTGTAPAGSELVVVVSTSEFNDNLFVIGSNADPETGPSYVGADFCGFPTPTTASDAGFPDMHIVMTVTGDEFGPSAATPVSLEVDTPAPGFAILGNGILEWGENAIVDPGWSNGGAVGLTLTGTILNPVLDFSPLFRSGHADGGFPPTITIVDAAASYGAIAAGASADCLSTTGDCYAIQLGGTHFLPAHIDALFDEHVTPTEVALGQPVLVAQTWRLHVGESFLDVDNDVGVDPFYPAIETIFHNGVTAGCGDSTTYCPLQNNLRQEMAVFLLKASLGSDYMPPACTPPGVFTDVPCPGLYTDWVEDLKARAITAGCNDGTTYCPEADVLRQEMAVFLLKTLLGSGYAPPTCTPPGMFTDVGCPGLYTDWIEDLKTRGITAGCGDGSTFCPTATVTRQEMAAFLTKTFGLLLYGP